MHVFAGAGGGILADMLLGHQPVCAVEINPNRQQILHERQQDGILPWFPIFGNIETFDGRPWRGIVDAICGGFPCQDVAAAGPGGGVERGARSGLWREQARLVREIRPPIVRVENSPMLTSRGLGIVLRDLAQMGYDAKWGVLSCRDVGGVHLRERIFIYGSNNRKKRVPTIFDKKVYRFSAFPWGKDVRGIEDLRNRPDIPEPVIWRTGNGLARAMDERIAAVGDGQVPRVAALAWTILSQ